MDYLSIASARGGIERAAHTLADGLARRGHEVTVFTHDPKPAGAAYDVSPLPWKSFVNTWVGRRITMGYLGNVLAVLPDYSDFDAIVMHGDSLLAPLTGKPVLRVMHGSARGEARSATSLGRYLLQYGVFAQELLTAFCQDGVVGVSESTKMENPFVRRVVPHGVDRAIFRPQPFAQDAGAVSAVCRVDGRPQARPISAGRIRECHSPRHPDATLTIVGTEGPAHPGVAYLTGVADEQLAELYRRSWVFASPSSYEGFGLPYLEAMACGTPVVATANPGSIEVLGDGAYGLLPPDSEFATTVAELLGDETRRAVLTAAGLKRADDTR